MGSGCFFVGTYLSEIKLLNIHEKDLWREQLNLEMATLFLPTIKHHLGLSFIHNINLYFWFSFT